MIKEKRGFLGLLVRTVPGFADPLQRIFRRGRTEVADVIQETLTRGLKSLESLP